MKPGYWWRAQNTCVDNAKLIRLSDKAHRNWFNLNCVANAHGGVLPSLEDVATKLRTTPARAAAAIAELVSKRLFDKRADGSFVPHDWNEWQYKTDLVDPTNAERQRNHRAKQKRELRELKALRDASHNSLRNGVNNGVTDVTAKRAEEVSKLTTTTVSVERSEGLGKGEYVGTPEFQKSLRRLS